jgi:hypothetical protein
MGCCIALVVLVAVTEYAKKIMAVTENKVVHLN